MGLLKTLVQEDSVLLLLKSIGSGGGVNVWKWGKEDSW